MRPIEIITLLRKAPFVPFGIYLSDGSAYPVQHPDQAIVTPRAVHVGVGGDAEQRPVQDVVICSLVHITRLGPVPRRRVRRPK